MPKSLVNSDHEHQYLNVTTTFANFNYFATFSKAILTIFKIANQIYDRNIAQAIGNMEMVSNNALEI